jgi:hypothetical protein
VSSEPWYLSYTSASSLYLRHWLTQSWPLAREWSHSREVATCPWNPNDLGFGQQDRAWNRNLPPLHELNFPDRSHATWIECCLHNGLIEEALQVKIDLLQEQTSRLQSDWLAARERHSNALLRRWKAEGTGEES